MVRRTLAALVLAAGSLAVAAPAATACQPEYCPTCPIPGTLGQKICPHPF